MSFFQDDAPNCINRLYAFRMLSLNQKTARNRTDTRRAGTQHSCRLGPLGRTRFATGVIDTAVIAGDHALQCVKDRCGERNPPSTHRFCHCTTSNRSQKPPGFIDLQPAIWRNLKPLIEC